ncbi:unnamed protein product [Ranitomeya imitator]|uniref:EMI domain-containing protein n=1 Tax=Ranitomeya imitator TaxID=111125 RepID=A0ABN9MJT7_9NEOB|nr:unnamed protein product [Ranitomeya imitator]
MSAAVSHSASAAVETAQWRRWSQHLTQSDTVQRVTAAFPGSAFVASTGQRKWCSFVRNQIVTYVDVCKTEKYVVRSQQPCPHGTLDCQKTMYRIAQKPIYELKRKFITSLEWKCCPGYSGSTCEYAAAGTFPCNQKKFKTCPFIMTTDKIKIPNSHQNYKIPGTFSCVTSNVVYLIICTKCPTGGLYVGSMDHISSSEKTEESPHSAGLPPPPRVCEGAGNIYILRKELPAPKPASGSGPVVTYPSCFPCIYRVCTKLI